MNDEEFPKDVLPFEEEIKKYIDKYVLEKDKEAHVLKWTLCQGQ